VLVGTTLPQFAADAEAAVAAAVRAEALGLDGVFVFNHLWPIGRPDGEVLECFSLLGALAYETSRVRLGPLVARIGLVPDAVLIHEFTTLARLVGDRLIAAIGAGDSLSAAENLAYGIAYPPAVERLTSVDTVCRALRTDGITTWAGGRSDGLRRVAASSADALNLWAVPPEDLRAALEDVPSVTWGGQIRIDGETDRPDVVTGSVRDIADHLKRVEDAGAQFAVCAPLDVGDVVALEKLAEVRSLVA
jgi:alkanesulfonate monooxygenase SsuD/methylene tetrahydromethanopterin reductase-like flavin-dependent oxidoreductase (luciferase family)